MGSFLNYIPLYCPKKVPGFVPVPGCGPRVDWPNTWRSYKRPKRIVGRQLEDRQLEDRQLEDRQLDDRQLDDRQLEDRQLEDRQLEDRQLEDRN